MGVVDFLREYSFWLLFVIVMIDSVALFSRGWRAAAVERMGPDGAAEHPSRLVRMVAPFGAWDWFHVFMALCFLIAAAFSVPDVLAYLTNS